MAGCAEARPLRKVLCVTEFIKKIYNLVFGDSAGAETIRYLIVGGLTTLVSFGLFTLLVLVSPFEFTVAVPVFGFEPTVTHIDVYNFISIVIAILFAYVTNKLIVFRRRCGSKAALMREFFKFIGSRVFTMVLEIGIVWLFYNVMGINALIGKVVATVVVVVTNYVLSKLIVFRGKKT